MSSPIQTVNNLMHNLRDQYRLDAPVLPFSGMSAALVRLWNMAVGWFPSRLPPYSKIAIEGEWEVTLPSGDSLAMTELYVTIELSSTLSTTA
jgi:hypothetical protein